MRLEFLQATVKDRPLKWPGALHPHFLRWSPRLGTGQRAAVAAGATHRS